MNGSKTVELGDDELPEPLRAQLWPSEWHVICPTCEHANHVERVTENSSGGFCTFDEDRFLRCAACDAFLDVSGARVESMEAW